MRKTLLASLIVGANAIPFLGISQAQAQSGARSSLEEVVVTARKREETIQVVPLAVSALTGDMLTRNNIVDVSDLTTSVPALTIAPGNGAGRNVPTFTIRGQRQQELSINADPSVGVYFGDIAVVRAYGVNQSLFDLQSVEVLKGPQGTLFGRNTTGGAVLFKPNRPSDMFEGYAQLGAGNYGLFSTEFMVNTPITDSFSVRVAARTETRDGYVEDVITGDDVDDQDNMSWRISALLTPNDDLESLFVYNRFLDDSGGSGSASNAISPIATKPINSSASRLGYVGDLAPANMVAAQQSRDFWKTASGLNTFSRMSVWDAANTTTWALTDSLTIKNIVGYRSVKAHLLEDTDGLPVPVLQIERDVPNISQISEELQLIGETDRLDWIAGLYYFREEGEERNSSITLAPASMAALAPMETPLWSLTNGVGENISQSVFTQGTYDLGDWVDDLSLTVGVRYTEDEREFTSKNRTASVCRLQSSPGVPLPYGACTATGKADFEKVTYNITLDYRLTPDTLVYLTKRRGYRSGGLGSRAVLVSEASVAFQPETVNDWELGLKSDWNIGDIDGRTNIALFHAENTDTQRLNSTNQRLETPTGVINQSVTVIDNATMESKGGEIEMTVLPLPGLELSGFWAVAFSEFTEYESKIPGVNKDTAQMGVAPQHTGGFTARYTLPLSPEIGEVSLQGNYYWTDDFKWTDTFDPYGKTESYGLVNLRADWRDVMGTSLDVGLYAKNVANEEYMQPLLALDSLGFSAFVPGDPRTFGLELKYRFGALGSN
jgi:iron complex outermembrane receptor protein